MAPINVANTQHGSSLNDVDCWYSDKDAILKMVLGMLYTYVNVLERVIVICVASYMPLNELNEVNMVYKWVAKWYDGLVHLLHFENDF